MFNLFGKKPEPNPTPSPIPYAARDNAFGDAPLDNWPNAHLVERARDVEPWASFIEARTLLKQGKRDEAVRLWKRILQMPDVQPQHHLQAWYFLREQGIAVPEKYARSLYGVVVEVRMEGGLDLLNAYVDGGASFYHHTGRSAIWKAHDSMPKMDRAIEGLLTQARKVAAGIQQWGVQHTPPPAADHARINILTANGRFFAYGRKKVLETDPSTKPLMMAATQLLFAFADLLREIE